MTPHRTPPPADLYALSTHVNAFILADTAGVDTAAPFTTLLEACRAATPEARATLAPILALWYVHPGDGSINLAAPWSHVILRVLSETAHAYRHKAPARFITSAMMLDAADMPGEWRAALLPLVHNPPEHAART